MSLDLFAGIPVHDYTVAEVWYERLLGAPPSLLPNETEAVWELADHRYLFIEVRPRMPGMPCIPSLLATSTLVSPRSPSEASSRLSARPKPTASARPPSGTRTATRLDSAARPPDREAQQTPAW